LPAARLAAFAAGEVHLAAFHEGRKPPGHVLFGSSAGRQIARMLPVDGRLGWRKPWFPA
jgi:hypothetical protein